MRAYPTHPGPLITISSPHQLASQGMKPNLSKGDPLVRVHWETLPASLLALGLSWTAPESPRVPTSPGSEVGQRGSE